MDRADKPENRPAEEADTKTHRRRVRFFINPELSAEEIVAIGHSDPSDKEFLRFLILGF